MKLGLIFIAIGAIVSILIVIYRLLGGGSNRASSTKLKPSIPNVPTTVTQSKTPAWLTIVFSVLVLIAINQFWQMYHVPKNEPDTSIGQNSIPLNFSNWDPENYAWKEVPVPEKLRGKAAWIIATGKHFYPTRNRGGQLGHIEIDPSTGDNPWRNFPAENKLPIPDKSRLCKLVIKSRGETIFAGSKRDSPIILGEKIIVSVNAPQANSDNWTLSKGNVQITFLPVAGNL